ncbi:MAG: MBL fold metallo-hydrolase [Planctomycetota bacterium]|nr:MBL fold metallo-hydrolase [Planctomycetota bacterium]
MSDPIRSIRDARLTLLGTGTSSGVPSIGCTCPVCRSDDPRDHRLRTAGALRFTDPDGNPRCILLDCGPDHRQQALSAQLNRADEILVTHAHVDHVWGIDELRRYNVMQDSPMRLATSADAWGDLERVYRHIFCGERGPNGAANWVADIEKVVIVPGESRTVHGLRILAIDLRHGVMPVLGFRIEPEDGSLADDPLFPLAWCTDVSSIPQESHASLQGVSTLILDALRYKPHPTHFTIPQAIEMAQSLKARRTILVHLAHDASHATLAETLPNGVEAGWDGLEVRSSSIR